MEECKNCELAVYCFSEPGTWVFRTKEEMEQKQAAISCCSIYRRMQEEENDKVSESGRSTG